jgi:cytochrome P450
LREQTQNRTPRALRVRFCVCSAESDGWERSEEFDIFRKHLPHISFAAGEHTCLGLHLARLETRVALDCLLSRLSNVNLVAEGDPHIHGQPFRSPTALPVTFDAT